MKGSSCCILEIRGLDLLCCFFVAAGLAVAALEAELALRLAAAVALPGLPACDRGGTEADKLLALACKMQVLRSKRLRIQHANAGDWRCRDTLIIGECSLRKIFLLMMQGGTRCE